jgi:cytochrome c553
MRKHSLAFLLPVRSTFALLCLSAVSGCTHPDRSAATAPGSDLYASCVACHGTAGQGNESLGAPAIAGLPQWYLEAQLGKFRVGVRGAHKDDVEGLRMRPMSRQMAGSAEVKAVAAYVAQLPVNKPPQTIVGADLAAGAASWNTCLACHGPDGKGNQAVNAPPLVGQSDWYLLTQLKKFKAGVRGTNPADTSGGTMRPMSMTLADEQAMKNVVAHVSTLYR